jgi:hypothetical protein
MSRDLAARSPQVGELSVKSWNSKGLRNYMADLAEHFGSPTKHHLDISAEEELLAKGSAHELPRADAERCLLLACEKLGIGVERLLREVFGRRVAAAVGDRLLDDMERNELERQGREFFGQAENSTAITTEVLEEVRRKQGALSEAAVKEILLKPVKKGGSLPLEQWDENRRRTIQLLHLHGVSREENDLNELMERAREEHGVILQDPTNPLLMVLWMCGVAMIVFLLGRILQ